MPTNIPTFNFNNFNATYSDISFVDLDDGDAFVVTPSEPSITMVTVGADGLSNISVNTNRSSAIAVNLKSQSPTNNYLAAIANDTYTGSGDVHKANFIFSDPSGVVPCIFRNCHLHMVPDSMAVGKDAGDKVYTWTFWCEEIVWTEAPLGLSVTLVAEYEEEAEAHLSALVSLQASL